MKPMLLGTELLASVRGTPQDSPRDIARIRDLGNLAAEPPAPETGAPALGFDEVLARLADPKPQQPLPGQALPPQVPPSTKPPADGEEVRTAEGALPKAEAPKTPQPTAEGPRLRDPGQAAPLPPNAAPPDTAAQPATSLPRDGVLPLPAKAPPEGAPLLPQKGEGKAPSPAAAAPTIPVADTPEPLPPSQPRPKAPVQAVPAPSKPDLQATQVPAPAKADPKTPVTSLPVTAPAEPRAPLRPTPADPTSAKVPEGPPPAGLPPKPAPATPVASVPKIQTAPSQPQTSEPPPLRADTPRQTVPHPLAGPPDLPAPPRATRSDTRRDSTGLRVASLAPDTPKLPPAPLTVTALNTTPLLTPAAQAAQPELKGGFDIGTGLSPLGDGPSATAPRGDIQTTAAPQNTLRPDAAPQLTRLIAEALQHTPHRPVEIMLDPQELGRVRLNLTSAEGAVIVSVLAERAETLDLMRRHISELQTAMHQIGYAQVSFDFGSGAATGEQGQERAAQTEDSAPLPADRDETAPAPLQITLNVDGGTAVDLRL